MHLIHLALLRLDDLRGDLLPYDAALVDRTRFVRCSLSDGPDPPDQRVPARTVRYPAAR